MLGTVVGDFFIISGFPVTFGARSVSFIFSSSRIFVIEGFFSVMFLLILNVSDDLWYLRFSIGECAISRLPSEFMPC